MPMIRNRLERGPIAGSESEAYENIEVCSTAYRSSNSGT